MGGDVAPTVSGLRADALPPECRSHSYSVTYSVVYSVTHKVDLLVITKSLPETDVSHLMLYYFVNS